MKLKYCLVTICLILCVFSCTSLHAQTTLPEEQGSLIDLIDKFSVNIIPRDSGKYVMPTELELKSFGSTFSLLLEWMNGGSSDRLSGAASNLSELKYVLVRFADIVTGRVFYLARESPGYNRGWGLYILYTRSNGVYGNLLIEVPHIGFDLDTEKIGIRSFIQSFAGFFLVAGAHRYANPNEVADVAHTEESVFHVIHKTLCTNMSTAIQIHGFAETSAGRQLYPQIILSSGEPAGSKAVTGMSARLAENGFTVGIFDGTKYTDLGATENIQGTYARGVGAGFIHMEIARAVRNSSELRGRVANSIESFAREFVIEIPELTSLGLTVLATISISWMVIKVHGRSSTRVKSRLDEGGGTSRPFASRSP
jgi:hypothetical protein